MVTFNFNISLSVLNHLGRNLYRNFITVIGEALSNSWDADAHNVYIEIDRENKYMSILDDGDGMDEDSFQNKFLKIGYSKRKNNNFKSPQGRPFIGRKGIGKLALLSCAKTIYIATKTENTDIVGGVIDNSELDKAITDDLNSQDYILGSLPDRVINKFSANSKGTLICFENITDDIVNTIDYIKKAIALYFKFSLVDNDFNIFVNDEIVDSTLLSDLALKTEFVWVINESKDAFLDKEKSIKNIREIKVLTSSIPIKGFIATTYKPADIKIRGTNEKVSLDLFVNGRLREKDLLKHIPTARIVESYTFGQIHCDSLDTGSGRDIFTSSREGIISNDPAFERVLSEVKRLFATVIEEWDILRRKYGSDGDPENMSISPKARRAQELYYQTIKDMGGGKKLGKKGTVVDKWVTELSEEAQFNIPSYAECFIAENLLRNFIVYNNLTLNQESIKEAQAMKTKENYNKNLANISFDIRQSTDDIFYLDMDHLANFVDKAGDKLKDAGISRSAVVYKPVRDAVGHTSLLTETAKQQLTVVFNNIQARLVQVLQDIKDKSD